MKIGIIQGTSQHQKHALLCTAAKEAAPNAEIISFGCLEEDTISYSYPEIALMVGLLLGSGAVDYIITGCSSGQGMLLACNSLPGVVCGYAPTPQDAFLFGRINGGNAISLPLGLGFGWAGEVNLRYTLAALFDGGFGVGYPPEEAARKKRDTQLMRDIKRAGQRDMTDILNALEPETAQKILSHARVTDYILKHGTNKTLVQYILERTQPS